MGHTKGIWYFSPSIDCIEINAKDTQGSFVAIIPLHWKNATENAKLIASSPDLLKALKLMVEQFEGIKGSTDNYKDVVAINTANRAIKKATQ